MTIKAYFMINVVEEFYQDGLCDVLRDLESIPEVKGVERVKGAFDLLARVETSGRTVLVANEIMDKEWVNNLNVLHAEPIKLDEHQRIDVEDTVSLSEVF